MAEDDVEAQMSSFFSEYVPPGYTGIRKFRPKQSSTGTLSPPTSPVEEPKQSQKNPKWTETYLANRNQPQDLISDQNYRPAGYGGHVPRSTSAFGRFSSIL